MIARNIYSGLGIIFSFLIGICPSAAEDATGTVYGYWVNLNGWVIETAPCGGDVCGQIVAVGGRTKNPQRLDEFNPDPTLRNRPLCGVTIFGSFVPNGDPGEWEDGWIYNPQNGKTYSSNMELADDGNLEVRGFVVSPIFGRTIVLTPGEEPAEPCDSSEPSLSRNAGGK